MPVAALRGATASTCAAAAAPPAQDAPPPPPAAELNLINLPTTTSLNKHQSYFRLTHRFARDLRRGDFGSLAEDFFSLDNGAVIGLEYRFGITSHLQAGVHRTTLSKTIQFFGTLRRLAPEPSRLPVAISLLGSIEGLANFHQNYQPGVGGHLIARLRHLAERLCRPDLRRAHTRGGHPEWPRRSRPQICRSTADDEHAHHDGTTFVGIGARVRIRPTAFVSGEYSPRVRATIPGAAHGESPSKNRRRATRCS